ncbi:hypothetical protein V8F20_005636 [Naviculisporaceae sp. PSN 640]
MTCSFAHFARYFKRVLSGFFPSVSESLKIFFSLDGHLGRLRSQSAPWSFPTLRTDTTRQLHVGIARRWPRQPVSGRCVLAVHTGNPWCGAIHFDLFCDMSDFFAFGQPHLALWFLSYVMLLCASQLTNLLLFTLAYLMPNPTIPVTTSHTRRRPCITSRVLPSLHPFAAQHAASTQSFLFLIDPSPRILNLVPHKPVGMSSV